jgi:chromosome segregation ATPase
MLKEGERMPDIPIFDAAGFFAQKTQEVEQALISKRAELAILEANRRNLQTALELFAALSPEELQTVQHEQASLKEVLQSNERSINAVEAEVALLSGKLAALHRLAANLEAHATAQPEATAPTDETAEHER